MPVKWNGKEVEREVNAKLVTLLDKLGIVGSDATKLRITKAGRVDTGRMRADIHHEVNIKKLWVRWGGNVFYLPFQELGTLNEDGSQRIPPMFALRGSLRDVKKKFNGIKV